MNRSSIIVVVVMLTAAFGLAGFWLYDHFYNDKLEGYYSIHDGFVDTTGIEQAAISFVQVEEYDSMMVLRVAERLTQESIERAELNVLKERTYLFYFFVPGDTAALNEEMIDELAYTHPDTRNPADRLVVVPGGWVVKAKFAPSTMQPKSIDTHKSQFYMPRAGIKALDLR